MFFEYCCYNKNLIEDVDKEISTIFNAIGSGFAGVAAPLHVLRQISQEILIIPDMLISCPIDYPLGCGDRKVRQHESVVGLKSGANCLDLVMNPYLFKKQSVNAISKDIFPIMEICSNYNSELRIIINYDLYEQDDCIKVCEILRGLGVETVIPSAGFSNDDIFENLLFCNILEKKLEMSAICTGRMWLEKHYNAALNSQISGLRAYSLSNIANLGVDKL